LTNLALTQTAPDVVRTVDIHARSTGEIPRDVDALADWQIRAHERSVSRSHPASSPNLSHPSLSSPRGSSTSENSPGAAGAAAHLGCRSRRILARHASKGLSPSRQESRRC
jgi:hypothetical protein